MNYFQAIILGIVEGITEFLPISSTGHMILAGKIMALPTTEFLKSFEISIQLGAILAVVVLYGKKFLIKPEIIRKVMVGFLPTAVIGLLLYKIVKYYLLGNSTVVVWALLLGGIGLIIFELWYKKKPVVADNGLDAITYRQAIIIGIFQSLAIIPGVSRSASTIVGGLMFGLNRKTIVEFSFLLAVPTMLAASGLDLLKSANAFQASDMGYLVVGFGVSFVVALLVIKWLLTFIQKYSFTVFGYYRIVVAVLFWLLVK